MKLSNLASLPACWTAHGLRFAKGASADADVHLVFGPVPVGLVSPVLTGPRRDVGPGDWLCRLGVDQRLRATAGKVITLDASATADPADLARWIQGPATAAILYQRGILPLHASAIALAAGAVAFLAPSGVGKSSLAAAFVSTGAPLLTDDLLAVRLDERGTLLAYPGAPGLRLTPEAWDVLGSAGFREVGQDPDGKRLAVPEAGVAGGPLPLTALFLLERAESVEVTPVSGLDLLGRLRRLVARPNLPGALGAEASVFEVLGRITERVPAWCLRRPEEGWSIPACQLLVRDSLATPFKPGSHVGVIENAHAPS